MIRKFLVVTCMSAFLIAGVQPAVFAAGSQDAAAANDDGTQKELAAVAGAGMMETHTYDYLEELSDDIGARVTGSPEAAQAEAWGVQKMKDMGLENVHTESWQLFRGWTRVSAIADLIAPIHRRLMIDSLGWVGSTPSGGVDAEVVPVNAFQLADETKNNAGKWRGKILLTVQRGEKPADSFEIGRASWRERV